MRIAGKRSLVLRLKLAKWSRLPQLDIGAYRELEGHCEMGCHEGFGVSRNAYDSKCCDTLRYPRFKKRRRHLGIMQSTWFFGMYIGTIIKKRKGKILRHQILGRCPFDVEMPQQ